VPLEPPSAVVPSRPAVHAWWPLDGQTKPCENDAE